MSKRSFVIVHIDANGVSLAHSSDFERFHIEAAGDVDVGESLARFGAGATECDPHGAGEIGHH